MPFSYPMLLADIGGTNCRVMTLAEPQAKPQPLARLASAEISDLSTALAALPGRPAVRSAILAVAGIVESPRMTLTNLPWSIDAQAVGENLGLERVMLVNDFEAQAAALTAFGDDDGVRLQQGVAKPGGTRVITGAGTGFGAALLLETHGGYTIVPTEAGHMDLPLMEGDDALFADALRARYGRVSIELAVSGPGLAKLDAALHRRVRERATADIVVAGLAREADAAASIAVYLRLFASAAANIAMATKATGGLWLAGGMIGRLLPLLKRDEFLAHFHDKPPMTGLLEAMPLTIVTREDSAFPGLAAIAAAPERFGMEHAPGLWRAPGA